MDIQYIMGIGAGVPTTFWSVSGDPRNGGYILEWALQISNTTTPPLVTSISYGDTEQGQKLHIQTMFSIFSPTIKAHTQDTNTSILSLLSLSLSLTFSLSLALPSSN